jgi:hypothetical protein
MVTTPVSHCSLACSASLLRIDADHLRTQRTKQSIKGCIAGVAIAVQHDH